MSCSIARPPARQRYREGFFTDGRKLMWEYPRATPDGEQMDFVEVMEINDDGLIARHCVYWGLVRRQGDRAEPLSALSAPLRTRAAA
jgi:hypothetical protein